MWAVHNNGTKALLAVSLTEFALLCICELAMLIQEERPLFLELLRISLYMLHPLSKNCLLSVRFLTFFPL